MPELCCMTGLSDFEVIKVSKCGGGEEEGGGDVAGERKKRGRCVPFPHCTL